MGANIHYTSEELTGYYTSHRNKWAHYYPSERAVFEKVMASTGKTDEIRLLDVGCAAGGLGRALGERFRIEEYVGIDIHREAIEAGKSIGGFRFPASLLAGDICELELDPGSFDLVVSLSCADWNVRTIDIIKTCWRYVRPGGHFVVSLRLTPKKSCCDFRNSYQYIHFSDSPSANSDETEKAPYVVFNTSRALAILCSLRTKPASILARGYWGTPSSTAVTPYDRLVFAALAVAKPKRDLDLDVSTIADIRLPADVFFDFEQEVFS